MKSKYIHPTIKILKVYNEEMLAGTIRVTAPDTNKGEGDPDPMLFQFEE